MQSSATTTSPHADRVVEARRLRRRTALRTRDSIAGIVVHTTGGGVLRRSREHPDRWPTPLAAAVHVYARVMDPGPHYVIGQDGTIVAMLPEEYEAWGAAAVRPRAYRRRGRWARERRWWAERWESLGVDTPYDLGAADGGFYSDHGRINRRAVHIEVVPPESGAREPWSDAVWDALGVLCLDVLDRWSVTPSAWTIVTHSDLCPLERGTPRRPWDPGPSQWPGPSDAFERLLRGAQRYLTRPR